MILHVQDIYIILRALNSYNNNPNVNFQDKKFVPELFDKIKTYQDEGISLSNLSNPDQTEEQIRSSHYGGADNPYKAIKVIDNWKANFNLGNAIKYICRVCNRYNSKYSKADSITTIGSYIEDLKKARTYLDFEIEKLEKIK